MGSEKQNLGEIYAARAMEDREPPVSPGAIPRVREARDRVYNGTVEPLMGPNGQPPLRNRKQKRRTVSPFTIVLILLGGAVSSVLYIGNILAVGHLMVQINVLQTKHQQILNDQELLKAQINRLSGWERIQQLAHDQLGLQNPKQLPTWIEIDPDRVNDVEEVFRQQMEHKR